MEKDSKQDKKQEGQNVKGRKCSLALKVGSMVLMIITTGIPIYFTYVDVMDNSGSSGRDTMADKDHDLIEYLVLGILWFMGFSGAAVFGTLQFIGARRRLDKAPKHEHDINTTLKILRFCQIYPMLLIPLGYVALLIGRFNNMRACSSLAFIDIILLVLVTFQTILAIESTHEIEMLKYEKEKRILGKGKQNAKRVVSENTSIV